MKRYYLVIGKHCWGRGLTLAKARYQARKAGGGRTGKTVVYTVDTPTDGENIVLPFVDSFGWIRWDHRAVVTRLA